MPDASKKNLAEIYRAHKPGCSTPYPVDEMPIIRGMMGVSSYVDDMVVEHPDGSENLVEVYGSPIRNKDGEVWASLVSFRNITESKKLEHIVRDSEVKFSKIFNESPYPIMIIDTENGCFTELNEAMANSVEYKREELIGKSALELGIIIPESQNKTRRLIAESGQFSNIEVSVNTKTGKVRYGLATGWIIELNQHKYLIQTIVDITERKEIEKALRESEEKYRFITEHSADVIWIYSIKTGKFKYISPSIFQLRGFTPEEATAQAMEDTMTPESMLVVNEAMASDYKYFIDHPESQCSRLREIQQYCKNGELIWVEMSTRYYFNSDGEIEVIGSSRNIEERKKYEQIIKDSESRVKAILAEKELILIEVHHRIKNNMNTVSSLLSLQASSMTEPVAIMALSDARNRIQSMSLLYDTLYMAPDYAQLSIKNYLASLIDDIIVNFPNSQMVKVKKVVQDFVLDVKRLQLLGIIINELITNIMKYAFTDRSEGLIIVSVSKINSQVMVSVQDDGIVIPETVSLENSTGFGLQLVSALAQQLNGLMRIERGNGTKVVLEFDV